MRVIRFATPALAGLLLVVALVAKRSTSTSDAFARAVAASDFPRSRGGELIVTEWDLMSLPVPAQRYLHFMGVVGRSRDWSFRAHMTGTFRTNPGQAWSQMEAWLLGPETTRSAAGPDAFNVAFTYAGHTVTAEVSIDERGAPRNFSTADRFVRDPIGPKHELVRARWTTPIDGWQMVDGRPIPTSGRAVWHLAAWRLHLRRDAV